jgi:hypothetical protein
MAEVVKGNVILSAAKDLDRAVFHPDSSLRSE